MIDMTVDTLLDAAVTEDTIVVRSKADVLADIAHPTWGTNWRVGWSYFVDEAVQKVWDDLSTTSRLVAYIHANRAIRDHDDAISHWGMGP